MKFDQVALGDVIEQIRGVSYEKNETKSYYETGLIPILRANNISDDTIVFDNLIYVPEKYVSPKQLIRKHDIIIAASSGSIDVVGKSGYIENEWRGSLGAFCKLIRPKPEIYPEYLKFYFITPTYRREISHLAAGANINNLRNEHINDLRIPLPPLLEQQRIASILDLADSIRRKNRQILAKYDKLAQSVLYEMFGDPITNPKGWELMSGDQYCDSISVGVVVRPASYYVQEGVPALRSLNIRPNRIQLKELVYFSSEANERELSKSIIRQNDVLIVRTGQPGTAAIVPKSLDGANCIDLIITRPNTTKVTPVYYSYFFNTDGGKKLVLGTQRGQIQKHFNIGEIRKAKIPIPPLHTQIKFASIIEQNETQKRLSQDSLTKSEELFQSLLQRAFRGEL